MAQRELIVTLPEEVDVRNADDVAAELMLAVSRSSVVIIDMHATAFCDCAGVRAIILAHKRAAESGAELRVVVTTMLVRRIFGLTGVDQLVDLYPSLAATRGALPPRPDEILEGFRGRDAGTAEVLGCDPGDRSRAASCASEPG